MAELIKMMALQSFIGVEGLITRDSEFFVRNEGRAEELERTGLAKREGSETTGTPEETKILGPSETQTAYPKHSQTADPDNFQVSGASETPEQLTDEAKDNLKPLEVKPYGDMNVTQLKTEAKRVGIQGYSGMNRTQLLTALSNIPE